MKLDIVNNHKRYVLIIKVLTCLVFLVECGQGCPEQCFCNSINKIVYCLNKGLKTIPRKIPKDTVELNLNKNEFNSVTLRRHNFSDFKQLKQLFLSECGIKAIAVGAFIDLVNLKWLDLSKNRIKDLQDFTFKGLRLDQLFLDGNEGIVLHKDTFNGLNASGLYLTHCGLRNIKATTLLPMNGSLKNLWLNNNKIRHLKPDFHNVFKHLKHLRLFENPLHCNCRMKWLKRFFNGHQKIFEGPQIPSCASPSHAHHRNVAKLSLEDFRCQSPIFNDVDLLFSNHNGMLRCTASGDPAPTLIWAKPNGERKIFFPSHDEALAIKTDAVMHISHTDDFYTGSYECLAMNDGGNVTLTLNVSWPRIEAATIMGYENNNRVTGYKLPKFNQGPLGNDLEEKAEYDKEDSEITSIKEERDLDKTFSLLELVSAIIGTFVATIFISFLILHIFTRIRASQVPRNRLSSNNHYASAQIPDYSKSRDSRGSMYMNNRMEDEDLYMGINDLPPR